MEVLTLILSLKREATRVELIISECKTKYMKTGRAAAPQQQVNKVIIDNQTFDIVDKLVYLGALARADNDFSIEIKRRILAANRSYHGLQRHLRFNILTSNTKCSIYKR